MAGTQSPLSELSAPSALIIELLQWLAVRPRSYSETMEAWRTSCPRMPVWEDAINGALIKVVSADGINMSESAVQLTPLGRAVLDSLG
jgi:hypothetical protein